jgi:hypothetical protein
MRASRRWSFLAIGISLGLLTSAAWAQQAGAGYLKAKINPGRAGIFVDGKYIGPAANFGMARKYSLPAGEHEIKFAEPRYKEFTTKVTIQAGKTTTISQSLQAMPLAKPPFGRLRTIGGDKFSAVFVTGAYMRHAGEFNNPVQGLLLNPGDYVVKIVAPSGTAHEEKVTIRANEVAIVKLGG